MSSGWIMLHRKLTDWEWYDDINTSRLFIHLLLTVNHKDKNWRGINIKRGSRLTSLDKISTETGLSVSKIRTSVRKLISTDEIASKSHAQHTVFTIKNYDSYQGDDKPNDKQVTNQSQSNDKALATNNNVKNENKDNKLKDKAASPVDFSVFKLDDKTVSEIKAIRQKNKGGKWTQRVANTISSEFQKAAGLGITLEEVLNEWDSRGWKSFKAEWMPINNKGGNYEGNNQGNFNKPVKLSAAERIRQRNEAKYGVQSSGGFCVGEDGGDIRGAVDEREWRDSIIDVESGSE